MTSDKLTVRDLVARQEEGGMFFVQPGTSAQAAARTMQERGVSAISVMIEEGDHYDLVGIVSEKDIAHLVAKGGDPGAVMVEGIMSKDPFTVDISTSLWETALEMLENNIRHLPVLEDGEPLSTVSIRDVLSLLIEKLGTENERLRADIDWIGYMRGE